MVIPEVEELMKAEEERRSVVLFGIEVREGWGEGEWELGRREREREKGREVFKFNEGLPLLDFIV